MVPVVLVTREVNLVAPPHIVALGDGVYRHKTGGVACVRHQSNHCLSIVALLSHEAELEAGIVFLFDIGQGYGGDVCRITLQVDGIVAVIAVAAAAVVADGIEPAVVPPIVVACLEIVAPVGTQCLAAGRKTAANAHADSPIQLVAVEGT